uniref:Mucin-13 n=1 Tax=Phascolarctos cinereus TaxID=38626 RepID=A0A6P5KA98_PHACI|nr:mucin-13 [Phascolarctos cinereus]
MVEGVAALGLPKENIQNESLLLTLLPAPFHGFWCWSVHVHQTAQDSISTTVRTPTASEDRSTLEPSGTAATQDPSAAAPSGTAATEDPSAAAPSGTAATQDPSAAAPSGTAATQDPSAAAPSGTAATQDPSAAAPSGTAATQDPSGRRPAGQQPRRTRARRRPAGRSHAGPERGGAQRTAATQDPSAAAPSGTQPRRTRARRRPADSSHAGPGRGGAQRDGSHAGPERGGAQRDGSHGGPERGGAQRDGSHAGPERGGAQRDSSHAGPERGGAQRDSSHAGPERGGAQRDSSHAGPERAAPSGTAATQDPSAAAPTGRSHAGPERGGAQRTHAGPSAAAPSGTQPRRTRARRRQRDAATQDPSAAAPSGTQPRRTRARRRPAAAATQDPDLITQPMQATSQTPSASVPDELCTEKICYGSSECIELNTTSFCLCPEGYYYKDSQCNQGRTFPGMVTILEYLSDLDNKNSPNYQSLHFKIEKLFASAFADNTTYGQTVILNVQPSAVTRSEMRSSTGEVDVWVVNIFDKNSDMTLDDVSKTIETQIGNDIISYRAENPCDFNGCKNDGEDCSNGFTCNCLQGLARPTGSSSCTDCSSDCSEINNKQCIKKTNSRIPECQCLPGYISEDETCRECDFGYSGVDCKDNYILIFTVVCTIGGAILLGTIIGLIVLARSNKRKKRTEEDSLISSEFSNMRLETTGFSNPAFSNGSLFPKVNARLPRVQSHPYEDPYPQRSMPARDY